MKKMFYISLLCLSFLHGCAKRESLQEKFNTLKGIDYSEFRSMSIVNRKGVYLVTYQGLTHKIKRKFLTKKISSVAQVFSKEKYVVLTKKDTDYIENTLKSFDQMGVLALSVDEKGNVSFSLPWYDKCTYYFLRLSSINTLEDIKKQYYQKYEDNWYMDKECAER